MNLRTFRIGEYAVGGIIRVRINLESIFIQTLDYDTEEEVTRNSFPLNDESYWLISDRLHELTSSFYAERIMKFIEENAEIHSEI
ncbi:hypothetical protein DCBHLPFO_00673 [Mycoplasmopsis arginini]|uniref:Uncharacterized protein n=1 Tax=Mycoplasmopsis arginini TaxID=2094 RepID=A0AA43QZJ4_MYCAR|nr:hypothetical protein [Mycoplasmopsis arginini]